MQTTTGEIETAWGREILNLNLFHDTHEAVIYGDSTLRLLVTLVIAFSLVFRCHFSTFLSLVTWWTLSRLETTFLIQLKDENERCTSRCTFFEAYSQSRPVALNLTFWEWDFHWGSNIYIYLFSEKLLNDKKLS